MAAATHLMVGLDSVYGDSVAGQVIERAIQRNRLGHSLLLHSGDAATLETFAGRLTSRLLGLAPEKAGESLRHPDCFTLRPSGKSRQIRIGDDNMIANTMRHFVHQLMQSPLSGTRKVGIVFEAERLNPNSANAFLKTLEEPPLDTTVLLLTTRPYSLLPTIRSRCLQFRVPAEPSLAASAAAQKWLADLESWLSALSAGSSNRENATHQVMTVYGLVARFSHWLEDSTAEALEQLKTAGALENLDEDEREALKGSTRVGVRQRFFAAIELAVCALARQQPENHLPGAISVTELERAASLLRVNLNDAAALELFLLASLRAWSRRAS